MLKTINMPKIHCYGTKYGYAANPTLWRPLRLSAEKVGVTVHGYGEDQLEFPLHYYQAKITDMIKYLETVDATHVLYVDTRDSMFTRWSEADALDALACYGARILISAEKNCYPYPSWAERYPITGSKWKYVNSGGFIGERSFVLDELKKIVAHVEETGTRIQDASDQAEWSWLYLIGEDIALDTECRLFQAMFMEEPGDFSLVDGEFRNKYFPGSRPQVAHFNGNATGIDRWLKDIHNV